MKRSLRDVAALVVVLLAAGLLQATPAAAVTVLPAPGAFIDGVPVALPYDDFFSYSGGLLFKLDPKTPLDLSAFGGPAGTGHLDVLLYTGAGGASNDTVAGGFVFEDPVDAPGGNVSAFSGTWGAGLQPKGPVTVDNLLAYLHNQFGVANNIPVFTFDIAEPGSAASRDLRVVARFDVVNPNGPGAADDVLIHSWFLDNTPNGLWDPASFITVPGEINVTGTSMNYTVDTTGSGKADFIIFSPTMDLSLYNSPGYEFRAFLSLTDIDGAAEEAFISGSFTTGTPPQPQPEIPEPASMLLMGLGGLGLLGRRRLFA